MGVSSGLRGVTRWDRGDQLVTEVLLGVLCVASCVAAVAAAVRSATVDEFMVGVDLAERATAPVVPSAERFSLGASESAALTVSSPTALERFAWAAPQVLAYALAAAVLWRLLRVFGSLRTGEPFTAGTARHLVVASLVLLVGGVVWALLSGWSQLELSSAAADAYGEPSPVEVSGSLDLAFLLPALVLTGLAEFFRRGTALRREVEGLV